MDSENKLAGAAVVNLCYIECFHLDSFINYTISDLVLIRILTAHFSMLETEGPFEKEELRVSVYIHASRHSFSTRGWYTSCLQRIEIRLKTFLQSKCGALINTQHASQRVSDSN